MYLFAMTIGMVGLTYASVPLYRMFCQATGFGGTTRRKTVEEKLAAQANAPPAVTAAAKSRAVVISFNADVAEGLPWRFTPTQKSVVVRPGETTLAFFTAKNESARDVTGVATYNVQPNKAGSHFNKVQCFCFEEQRLRAGEEVDMPVFFYLDPEFATDAAMADVNDVTLSYTFFRSDDYDELDDEEEEGEGDARGVRMHGSGVVPVGVRTHAALAK
jgi:cytochrome c oxidase assembly protein subunit 11